MSMKMETISGGASLTPPPQSPSFNAFSSENIADVAARVVKELNLSHDDPFDDEFYSAFDRNLDFKQEIKEDDDINQEIKEDDEEDDNNNNDEDEDEDEEESEFEFAILNREDSISPISADEIFSNGQIRPIYPIFNTDLVYGHRNIINNNNNNDSETAATIRVPLRKFFEERESGSGSGSGNGNGVVSCSSSEAEDELEGVPPGTYCVWTPKKKEEIMMRKKSKSTSNTTNSRRWKFLNLLHRSNSDGKDTFVFLTPSNTHNNNNNNNNGGKSNNQKSTTTMVNSNNNNSNGKKMVRKGEEKRKSYLPYRQDLVGFFANVNGISRTVRPF